MKIQNYKLKCQQVKTIIFDKLNHSAHYIHNTITNYNLFQKANMGQYLKFY